MGNRFSATLVSPQRFLPRKAEARWSHAVKRPARRCTARRGAVIALIVAVELGYAGLAIGVAAPGGSSPTSTATVSIAGAAGAWTPAPTESSAAPVDEPPDPDEPEPATRR